MNNNPRFDTTSKTRSPDDIRSDIDTTRRRMDDTIDALSSRLKGRHLLDEVLGYFRSSNGNGRARASQLGSKVADSAGTAMHAAVDTLKAHPLPAALIGAGVAWLIYEKRKPSSGPSYDPDYDSTRDYATGWEEDVTYDYTEGEVSLGEGSTYGAAGTSSAAGYTAGADMVAEGEYTTESTGRRGRMQDLKARFSDKASAAKSQLRDRSSQLRDSSRERAAAMRERMGAGYQATRQRVAETVDERPLESALACLALGVVAGLLIPAPRAAREMVAPTANRLRERAREAGRDFVERGKHVAQAAAAAARDEAKSQGLTPEALKEKAGAVADRAKSAASETAESEGMKSSDSPSHQPSQSNPPGAPTSF